MTLFLNLSWYNNLLDAFHGVRNFYVKMSKWIGQLVALVLLSPVIILLLVLMGLCRMLTTMVIKIGHQHLTDDLTPAKYAWLMKDFDRIRLIEGKLAYLKRYDIDSKPFYQRFIHKALVNDTDAFVCYKKRIGEVVDQKLAAKDGTHFKSLNHRDLWDSRPKVYSYKF